MIMIGGDGIDFDLLETSLCGFKALHRGNLHMSSR